MKKAIFYSILCLIMLALNSCASTKSPEPLHRSIHPKDYYTSSFPTKNVSDQLQQIQRSVLRVTSRAFYKIYTFNNPFITLTKIRTAHNFKKLASDTSDFNHAKAGTAVC